jgi:hypothetical protein
VPECECSSKTGSQLALRHCCIVSGDQPFPRLIRNTITRRPIRGFLFFRVEGYQSASVTTRPCLRLLCDTVAPYLPSIISFSGLHHHNTPIFQTGFVFPSRGVPECERGNRTMSQPASQHGCAVYWLKSFLFGCSATRFFAGVFVFPSRGMPGCDCGSKTMFKHAAQHGCAVSRAQPFRFPVCIATTRFFCWGFACHVEEHRSGSVAPRPCLSLLCDPATPYPSIGHFLFWSASPLHADSFVGVLQLLLATLRSIGVGVWHQDHVLATKLRRKTMSSFPQWLRQQHARFFSFAHVCFEQGESRCCS